jgi:hypothetical protein
MLRILRGLPDRFEVCYEASCGYGHYHDLLRPLAARVLVAHPGHLRLIFRSKDKNDRKDAERLAKLLYLGETPTVHVPAPEVRTWRELIACRGQVIAKRTRAKNAVRALLRGAGVTPPKQPGLWTKKGLAWLRQLDLPTASQQLRRDLLLEEIETLLRQVRRIEQQLILVVIAVPERQLLVAVGRVIDRIEVERQVTRRGVEGGDELVNEDIAQPLEGLDADGVFEAGERRLAGQVVPVRGAVGDDLEDGAGAEGVVVVLVLVAGQDAVDAGADHRQEGVLGQLRVAGVVESVGESPREPDALIELADGQEPGVAGKLPR